MGVNLFGGRSSNLLISYSNNFTIVCLTCHKPDQLLNNCLIMQYLKVVLSSSNDVVFSVLLLEKTFLVFVYEKGHLLMTMTTKKFLHAERKKKIYA